MNQTLQLIQLEEFFSPSLFEERDRDTTKKQIYIDNISTAFNGMCSVKPNIEICEQMTDLLIEKGRKLIAIFVSLSLDEIQIENKQHVICIYVSLNTDIFKIINKIITIFNKRNRTFNETKIRDSDTDDKYKNIMNEFYVESIVECDDSCSYLTKKEVIPYFLKWCEERCIKISSRILFSYMNDKIGIYKAGWKGYKLNCGITEDDFE